MQPRLLRVVVVLIAVVSVGFAVARLSADEQKKSSDSLSQRRPLKKRQVAVAELDKSIELVGLLGKPLGEYMTIEAVYFTQSKGLHDWLRVTVIDGVGAKAAIEIHLSGIKKDDGALEAGKTYRIRGYESGGYIGIPEDIEKEQGAILMQAYKFHFMSDFVANEWAAMGS